MITLHDMGWDDAWRLEWERHAFEPFGPARITVVHRSHYEIWIPDRFCTGEVTGKMIHQAVSPGDYPVVGDWAAVHIPDMHSPAIIHGILPRRTCLQRKSAGREVLYQPIAANIDTALIVQAVDRDFNLPRLERYLVMIHDTKIRPVILLSKCDLIPEAGLDEIKMRISARIGDCPVISCSSLDDTGIETVRRTILPGKTHCLLGSSGVGKTTLLNRLLMENRFETRPVREKDQRGRHTTARRQLIILDQGGLIIDTPGMRELGNIDAGDGIETTFSDILDLADSCRFRDCTHTVEAGCAVREAVDRNQLDEKRYENFLKLRRESEYHARSYMEKRQRDKAFGKMVKSIMKDKKRQWNRDT